MTKSQKLRIAQEVSYMHKISASSIPIYPANLDASVESLIFLSPFSHVLAPVASKRDLKFYTHQFY